MHPSEVGGNREEIGKKEKKEEKEGREGGTSQLLQLTLLHSRPPRQQAGRGMSFPWTALVHLDSSHINNCIGGGSRHKPPPVEASFAVRKTFSDENHWVSCRMILTESGSFIKAFVCQHLKVFLTSSELHNARETRDPSHTSLSVTYQFSSKMYFQPLPSFLSHQFKLFLTITLGSEYKVKLITREQ